MPIAGIVSPLEGMVRLSMELFEAAKEVGPKAQPTISDPAARLDVQRNWRRVVIAWVSLGFVVLEMTVTDIGHHGVSALLRVDSSTVSRSWSPSCARAKHHDQHRAHGPPCHVTPLK